MAVLDMFIDRDVEPTFMRLLGKFPAVSLSGPRQSGKSTLLQAMLPEWRYVSLEDEDMRAFARNDPRGFLSTYPKKIILDEAQRVPELFSYLQGVLDTEPQMGRYVLSGSQDFLLMSSISQSLAGRVGVLRLLPLSLHELNDAGIHFSSSEAYVLTGGFPAIYDRDISVVDYFPSYVQTYLERDVRSEVGPGMLSKFRRFLTLCALRVGSLLNKQSLARDCEIDVKTADAWLSLLESARLVRLLAPYSANLGKRLVRTPKLYICDTGLACALLRINSLEALRTSPMRGSLFENAVIEEVEKASLAAGSEPHLSFWRDSNGVEVDLIIETGGSIAHLVEIKSSATLNSRFFSHLAKVADLLDVPPERRAIVYAGNDGMQTSGGRVLTLHEAHELADTTGTKVSQPRLWTR